MVNNKQINSFFSEVILEDRGPVVCLNEMIHYIFLTHSLPMVYYVGFVTKYKQNSYTPEIKCEFKPQNG